MPISHSPPTAPAWLSTKRPRVLLLGSGDRPNLLNEAKQLRPVIDQHVEVALEDFHYEKVLAEVAADLAIVLGGDGSILRAALQMQERQIPILGVNMGKLGFLASVPPPELARILPEVICGECRV